jgi:dihydroorotase
MSFARADLVVRGGRIVSPAGTFQGGIAARDGVIVGVGQDHELPQAHEVIDAAGRDVLPGVIDCHVHIREPGYEYKEDWRSGTAAAACGGVTTVFDMPNTMPVTADAEGFRAKDARASRGAYVDYGLYGLLGQHNVAELQGLADLGVIGFKCYMGETTGKIPPPDDGTMLEAFEIVCRLGLRVAVHAENDAILQHLVRRLKAAGRTDPFAHVESRPDVCAVEAVGRAIAIAEAARAPLHILHESCRDSLPVIRAAKQRGVDVTAETCPHYLLLTAKDMSRLGAILRVNPPVRFPGHAEALWKGLDDGTLDMLATDHAPHTPEEKTQPNIWDGHSGFPGVETAVPLMLNEVNRGRMTIERYVEWSAAAPARAWGLYPRKGSLQVGSDADMVIVDMSRECLIRGSELHSKSKITPFEGMHVRGVPVYTIVRGRVVFREGELVGEPGWGRRVTPRRFAPRA